MHAHEPPWLGSLCERFAPALALALALALQHRLLRATKDAAPHHV
jgi:hypothetical protein